ncbi:30S ribosomal protein S1 [Apilactobacillus timberlakei]|uniref:30S ribosomal protein S1 n=1 Tax=Apilactobacillus timberlakei TaxID=2008380 RepID=UPI00112B74DB|nr:30S ribosomal protein S1 [Apilactobacillus timberlakei]TPR20090.1 30S ribosomal protein S1 [Apilactobacillus timberlakei]TPR21808.1 30S ribosomal protein S1 [Apilactobacillus timberlakei]TPR23054.1 30S ribosomal protein S1 [Apilactobacillus timberlakei]TPR23992.1 30S ribosomal protein S1 [Apilactobacillus timberlakei]
MSESDEKTNKDLLEALDSVDQVNINDVVSGEVLAIDNDHQLIIGIDNAGVEGVVPRHEISSSSNNDEDSQYKVGDKGKFVVLSRIGDDKEGGSFLLSVRRLQERKVWDELQEKSKNDEIITVTVKNAVRGGLVVDAGVRGFIPASMITNHFVRNLNQYDGQQFECKIVEIIPEKNRLVLSHSDVMEQKQEKALEEVMGKLSVGDVVEGKVARMTNFGAFVDLGGVDGLVHVSEISYERVNKPSDVLKNGQDVKVKVIALDKDKGRISLSIKQTMPQPWDEIEEKAPQGSIVEVTIKRLVDFGAFAEVIPGVEGLIHISQISHEHVNTPADVLKVGQTVKAKVLDVQPENHRLALSMRALEPEPENGDDSSKENAKVSDNSTEDAPEEENGFTLGDIVGKGLDKDNQ